MYIAYHKLETGAQKVTSALTRCGSVSTNISSGTSSSRSIITSRYDPYYLAMLAGLSSSDRKIKVAEAERESTAEEEEDKSKTQASIAETEQKTQVSTSTWMKASAGTSALLMAVPEVRSQAQLQKLIEMQIEGTPQEQAIALLAFIREEGAAFCKLAQVAAEQPGVVDKATRDALRMVQTDCKPAKRGYIRGVLEKCIATNQLSADDVRLSEFVEEPLGVGSVAQVHACGDVVVKIALLDNLKIMEKQAEYLPKLAEWPILSKTPLANLAMFIKGAMRGWRGEFVMDGMEARSLRAFNALQKENPDLVVGLRVPEVKAACSNVLVMSRETGRMYKNLTKEEQRKCMAKVVEADAKSLFAIGIVHCDPHPGNIMLNDNEEVVLLDWGAVTELPDAKVAALKAIFIKLPDYIKDVDAGVTPRRGEREIAQAMSSLGFTTVKNSDEGLAMLAYHAFDSRLPAPLNAMKEGKYGLKSDPPVQAFPSDMTAFIRFRSVLGGLVANIAESFGEDGKQILDEINLVKQFSEAARAAA